MLKKFSAQIKKHWIVLSLAIAIISFGFFTLSPVFAQINSDTLGVTQVGEQTGLGNEDLRVTIGKIIQVILGFLGVVAIVIVLYGGFMYMTAGGSDEKVAKARKILINGGIGLVIIFSAYAITSFVISKLVDATGAGAGGNIQQNNDAGQLGGAGLASFKALSIAPTGEIAVRNVKVRVTFSKDVVANTINADSVKITNSANQAVEGTYSVSGRKVVFTPAAACPEPNAALKCFDSNTKFKVDLNPQLIKSIDGLNLSCAAGNICVGEFTTGNLIDVEAPKVLFVEPLNNARVSADSLVTVDINAVDDSGVSLIGLVADGSLVDEKGFDGGSPKEAMFDWSTDKLPIGLHKLKATANDIDDHNAETEISVKVLPKDCFGDNGEIVCGRQECGSCENGPCKNDLDCASGYFCQIAAGKEEGQCVALPVISRIAPAEGAVGNLITIFGSGFQNFVEGSSKVYFANGKDAQNNVTYTEAAQDNCRVWTDNKIIAKVPAGIITGPIKVVNKDSKWDVTDNNRGAKVDYVLNPNLVNPGLCSVTLENCACQDPACSNCLEGNTRQSVKASGNNFGTKDDANFDKYHLYFGEQPSLLGQGGAWAQQEIRNVQIPDLSAQSINVVVGKGERCFNAENKECVKGTANCRCTTIYSNPVPFRIASIQNLPRITNINPNPTAAGQLLTISGENFGANVGVVTLIKPNTEKVVLNLGCNGQDSWSDVEVLVKLPTPLAVGEYRIIVTSSDRLASEPAAFTVKDGVPGPELCRLSPNNGPVGLSFNLAGKNFGDKNDYKIFFAKTGQQDDPGVAVNTDDNSGIIWGEESIKNAKVPADAISGEVYLVSPDNKDLKSNGRKFTVGTCSGNSCGEGNKCCSISGACVAAADACPDDNGSALLSEFAWVVSTGEMPKIPQLWERTCVKGEVSQSPSPTKNNKFACPNVFISGTFNQLMDPATLDGNITIKRCANPTNTLRCKQNLQQVCEKSSDTCECIDIGDCNLTECKDNCLQTVIADVKDNDIGTTWSDISCTVLKDGKELECDTPGINGCNCAARGDQLTEFRLWTSVVENSVVFKPTAENRYIDGLYLNTKYAVTVTGGATGVKNNNKEIMPYDYSWEFQTTDKDCAPETLLMSPSLGILKSKLAEQSYLVSGQYKCESITLNRMNWDWSVSDPALVNGAKRATFLRIGKDDSGDRKDIGIFGMNADLQNSVIPETTDKTQLTVAAKADLGIGSGLRGNVTKTGKLAIEFADPKVVSVYPSCQEACINSEIGVEFNTEMNSNTINIDGATPNVLVYGCKASDCVVMDENPIALKNKNLQEIQKDPETKVSILTFNPSENLTSNKFYRVILKSGIASASGAVLTGYNYRLDLDEKADPDAYSWTFKTKESAEPCAVDKVKVSPENYISTTHGELIEYRGLPMSAADKCSPAGQILNVWDYNWDWENAPEDVAELVPQTIKAELPAYCTENCLTTGSATYGAVCGNNTKEKGEDCDDGNLTNNDGCSDICLREQLPICNNLTDVNCCGNGKTEGNEECDFGCEYKKSNGEACTKGDADCLCISKESSCAYGCLNAGTGTGFVCGNGKVEPGEDTDDGNKTGGDGVSAKCLNEGSKFKSNENSIICGDGNKQGGEECEVVCKKQDGSACVKGTDGCVCANNPYCNERCLLTGFVKCKADNSNKPCCGNGGEVETYGGIATEECEAVCTKPIACESSGDSGCVQSCNFGDAGCSCTFPIGCSDKCLNTGSDLQAAAVCRNGVVDFGEDEQCEVQKVCRDGDNLCESQLNLSPWQIFKVLNPDISALYDREKRFAEKSTTITSTASEKKDNPRIKSGNTLLIYRKYSCDLASPVAMLVEGTIPKKDESNVCRNANIRITFDQEISQEVSKDSIKLFYTAGAGPEACLLGTKLEGNRCLVPIATAQLAINPDQKSVLLVTPEGLLPSNKNLTLEVKALKDSCGQSFDLPAYSFTTQAKACRVNSVVVSPADKFYTDPNHVETYTASAQSFKTTCKLANGTACNMGTANCNCIEELNEVHGIPAVYDWSWQWIENSDIVTSLVPEADPIKAKLTAGTKNGKAKVQVELKITVDKLGAELGVATQNFSSTWINSQTKERCQKGTDNCVEQINNLSNTEGRTISGFTNLEILICENVWNPTVSDPGKWQVLEYSTDGGRTPTHLVEQNYNVGLFYCRDAGKTGDSSDDLPKLSDIAINLSDEKSRWGVYFDASNDWMRLPHEKINQFIDFNNKQSSWTLESWIYNDTLPDQVTKKIIYKNLNDNGVWTQADTAGGNETRDNIQLWIGNSAGNRAIGFTIRNKSQSLQIEKMASLAQLAPGFNHVALVYNGASQTASLYINAVLINPRDLSDAKSLYSDNSNLTGKDLFIGSRGMAAATSLAGYIDDIRIWKEARTAEQISQYYNKVLTGRENNLVTYWNFNRDLRDKSFHGNDLIAHCTASRQSKCEGELFKFINLTTLAQEANLDAGEQLFTIQDEELFQCADGIDNDRNGLIDRGGPTGDPKCEDDKDKWEEPKMLAQYFFKRDDLSPDVISLRIYENPEGLSPDMWYQSYAPNPSDKTQKVEVDCSYGDLNIKSCYIGAKDDASTYIAAANITVDDQIKSIFNNIYLLGYSKGSDEKTLNIYNQLIKYIKFNSNIVSIANAPKKITLIEDTKRVADLVFMRQLINNYKRTNGNKVPALAGGSYLRGISISSWPSWNETLGKALDSNLPTDPDNHFEWSATSAEGGYNGPECVRTDNVVERCLNDSYQCSVPNEFCVACPAGASKETCYKSSNQSFTITDYFKEATVAQKQSVYSYKALSDTCYELRYKLESKDSGYSYKVKPELTFTCP